MKPILKLAAGFAGLCLIFSVAIRQWLWDVWHWLDASPFDR
jgi:hypothetical protein